MRLKETKPGVWESSGGTSVVCHALVDPSESIIKVLVLNSNHVLSVFPEITIILFLDFKG